MRYFHKIGKHIKKNSHQFFVYVGRKLKLLVLSLKDKTVKLFDIARISIGYIVKWLFPGQDFKSLLLSSLHSIWMIGFSLLWLGYINTFDGFDFMRDLMGYNDLLSHRFLNLHPGSDIGEKYLLTNTSNNSQLLATDNDNQINTVITDRKELLRVLEILNKNSENFKYIICDIFFSDPDTVNDPALSRIITQLDEKKKIILPYYFVEEEDFIHYVGFPEVGPIKIRV